MEIFVAVAAIEFNLDLKVRSFIKCECKTQIFTITIDSIESIYSNVIKIDSTFYSILEIWANEAKFVCKVLKYSAIQ